MNDRLLVVCASRDRNAALQSMLKSVMRTSSDADVAVYIDDDQTFMYEDILKTQRVKVTIGPKVGPCKALNRLVADHPGYVAYGAATDDCQFLTPGWDSWALATARNFPGQIGGFHPYLEFAHYGQRMDFPWVTGRWIETIGWLCHPAAYHFYWDILLEVMAEQVGIVRALRHQFAVEHIGAVTDDVHTKTVTDARNVIPVIGLERRALVEKLREAACQPLTS